MQSNANIPDESSKVKCRIGFENDEHVNPEDFKNVVQTETESPLAAQQQYDANEDFAVFATKDKAVGGFLNLQEK